MKEKKKISPKKALMKSFILCPFMVVVLDPDKESGVNIITVSYVGVLSEFPPIIGLAIRSKRHSSHLIENAREFTLNLPTLSMLPDLDFCGTFSGKRYDKALLRSIQLEPPDTIKTPRIKASPVVLECQLRDILRFSTNRVGHDYYIADVVACYHDEDFLIEQFETIITANLDYRSVGSTIGKAIDT